MTQVRAHSLIPTKLITQYILDCPSLTQYRLDKVAEAGLKIWITELTINSSDEHGKAAALEQLLTLFFSHPAVNGIILWHFWDGSNWHQTEALFTGPTIAVSDHSNRLSPNRIQTLP